MKKFIALLLILIFVFSIISCEDEVSVPHPKSNPKETTKNINSPEEVKKTVYHTINFQTNGGSNISPVTAKKGSQLNSIPTITKENHLFEGWYYDESLTNAVVLPISIEKDSTFYAKWLRIKNTAGCKDCSIKFLSDINYSAYYYITPNGFDMQKLETLGYKMKITVTYEVKYEKDYDVLWDIGYMGAPKYQIAIINNNNYGTVLNDNTTNKTADTRTITYSSSISDLKNDQIRLAFVTDNTQNIIHFKNIKVSYECYK
ncbi:MAG: hypothetical protein E7679_04740 [Ruminococcaceae bacterium]|nr:hypothetical protein [Oscillospiraceae bacterium]